ncbi:Protein of unknown function [Salinihabitans flavidus]|uniref:DUF1194 domain-containing protein n=1 Tax=Salinihabitans flavidus TaxID=569882 RepID=A0A1H8MGV5_9RHOB|nr:DUF1194 domain-containing protein [Salinihabitans flavidus]SEO16642.1 Protein of unknown function [Salinihabitans flavidus]
MVRALALLLSLCAPLGAQAQECRLALLLALDVSASVDEAEDALQRKGLAAALLAPEVQEAFFAAPPVALAAYEWSGRLKYKTLLDWTMIDDRGALLAAANRIAASTRSETEFPTAMGYALGHGATLLQAGPACLFKTLDMSGDGVNNEGFPPAAAYAEFPFNGVTVNGLVINGADFEGEISLIDYYREEVIRGPGAFLEVAQGFADFERAMTRKLLREVSPRTVGALSPG